MEAVKQVPAVLRAVEVEKKMGMNITHVPMALHRGAKIYTSTRAIRVETSFGRARAVEAVFQSATKPKLRLIARRGVVVAASVIQTPGILRRSGVRLSTVGKYFQAHTGTSLAGRFKQVVAMQRGATQGYNCTNFVNDERFKIETLSLPPEMLSLRVPGLGPELVNRLTDYPHVLNWALVVRSETHGTIQPFLNRNLVFYTPTAKDLESMRKGLRLLSEMMFEAGATEVWPNIHGFPVLKSPDDLKFWDRGPLDPKACGIMLSHLFGSARMGKDERNSVVGLDFQVHGTRGLYVLDSSLFPTTLGVNPQHTIMAVARLGATKILERPLPARS